MLHKNWKAICDIPDVYLKLFIALSSDDDSLRRLEKGFPHLFLDEEPEHPGPFPLSVLRHLVESYDRERTTIDEIMDGFGLPAILCAHQGAEVFDTSSTLVMPQNLIDKYDDLVAEQKTQGNLFPWVLLDVMVEETRFFVGWINSAGKDGYEDMQDMYLYPCDLVDVAN